MQIEISELEPCKLAVRYEANVLEIMDKRAEVEKAFLKAPVKGFRPGAKIPMDAIRMVYRSQIDDSLKRALAEDAFHKTVFEKKLRPHGAPKFNALLLDGGKFTCDFELLTKPEFELASYTNLQVPKPVDAQNVEEISQQMLQELRMKFGEVAPYTDVDFIQDRDSVILDYEATLDGEKVSNLCATGEMLIVGSNSIPDFDNNLFGMKMGDTREFDIHAPLDSLPSIAGKTLHFKVTLSTGAKTIPCPLNDELATRMGKKDFAELQTDVKSAAAMRTANATKMALHDAIAKRLVADNVVDVPNWMSLSEARYLAFQAQLNWDNVSDIDKEKFLEVATKNVKLSLVLDKIREKEKEAQLSDQEIFEIVKQNLAQTKVQKPLDEIIQEMNRTGYLQILFSRIRDEYATDFVVKSVQIIE